MVDPVDEPRFLQFPMVDPQTGLLTAQGAVFFTQLYGRIGQLEGILPEDLVRSEAIQDDAVSALKLQDNAVSEPKLQTNAVSTVKVQSNAITIPGSALSASALSFKSTSYVDVQTVTVTPTSLNPLFIFANVAVDLDNTIGPSQRQVFFRLRRGTTNLHPEWPLMFVNAGSTFSDAETLNFFDATPPSTSTTYRLQLRVDSTSAFTTAQASYRSLVVLETKR